jgi:hypothetical protein
MALRDGWAKTFELRRDTPTELESCREGVREDRQGVDGATRVPDAGPPFHAKGMAHGAPANRQETT